MAEFAVKMDMLISSLREKNEALTMILNITENQGQLLKMDKNKDSEMLELFGTMNEAKQEHIERTLELDRLFQGVFEGISENFEEQARGTIEKTATLQSLTNEALELDVKIRASEQKNRTEILQRNIELSQIRRAAKPAGKSSKAELLKKYAQNKKPAGNV